MKYTKQQIIDNALAHKMDWSKVGYGTVEKFIEEIKNIDDKLFDEWFDLKPGDKFLAKPGNSWGHPRTRELIFKSHSDWEFPNGVVGNFETQWMVWCFISSFAGKVKAENNAL